MVLRAKKQNSYIFNFLQSIFAVRLQTDSKLAKNCFFGEKKIPKIQDKSAYCWPPVDFSAISYLKDTELTLQLTQMSIKIITISYDNLR